MWMRFPHCILCNRSTCSLLSAHSFDESFVRVNVGAICQIHFNRIQVHEILCACVCVCVQQVTNARLQTMQHENCIFLPQQAASCQTM